MNVFIIRKEVLSGVATLCVGVASATVLMNEGLPTSDSGQYLPDDSSVVGLLADCPANQPGAYMPTGVSQVKVLGDGEGLSLPLAFSRAGIDAAVGRAMGFKGVAQSASGENAKFRMMSESLQARTGTLYFRLLLKSNEKAQAAMGSSDSLATGNYQGAGWAWSLNDWGKKTSEDGNWRCTRFFNGNTYSERRLWFGFLKDSSGKVSLRLFVSGSAPHDAGTAATVTSQNFVLVETADPDSAYVCFAQVEIAGCPDGKDIIRAFACPADNWPRIPTWAKLGGRGYAEANLIGGVEGLHGYLVIGGNQCVGTDGGLFQADEFRVADKLSDVVYVTKKGVASSGSVLVAGDSFPVGTGGYPSDPCKLTLATGLTDASIFGFAETRWTIPGSSSMPMNLGEGSALAFPALFAQKGILAKDGSSVGYCASGTTGGDRSFFRTINDGVLHFHAGETLCFRLLISISDETLAALKSKSSVGDAAGTPKMESNGSVNYYGCGLVATNESTLAQGTTFVQMDRYCWFGFVRTSSDNVNLQLNLRGFTGDGDSRISESKQLILVPGVVGGKTYICHCEITMDAGTNGKETIRAFAQDVDTYNVVPTWVPALEDAAAEVNVFDLGANGYRPDKLMVGGRYGTNGGTFKVDEIGFSVCGPESLTYYEYPRKGMILLLK